MGTAAIGAILAIKLFKGNKKLSPIVQGQTIRGCDPDGCGHFGAGRGDRKHNGIDIVVQETQPIMSPINGEVVRYAFPYEDRSFAGLAIQNDDYFIKIFYMAPSVEPGTIIKKGQVIGFAQNIQRRYGPEITPHVHLEVWDRTKMDIALDPAKLF